MTRGQFWQGLLKRFIIDGRCVDCADRVAGYRRYCTPCSGSTVYLMTSLWRVDLYATFGRGGQP